MFALSFLQREIIAISLGVGAMLINLSFCGIASFSSFSLFCPVRFPVRNQIMVESPLNSDANNDTLAENWCKWESIMRNHKTVQCWGCEAELWECENEKLLIKMPANWTRYVDAIKQLMLMNFAEAKSY